MVGHRSGSLKVSFELAAERHVLSSIERALSLRDESFVPLNLRWRGQSASKAWAAREPRRHRVVRLHRSSCKA